MLILKKNKAITVPSQAPCPNPRAWDGPSGCEPVPESLRFQWKITITVKLCLINK